MAVRIEVDERVATIVLDRPDVLNAIDHDLLAGLDRALARAAEDDVEAVVLTGAGRGFCAGGDLRAVAAVLAEGGDVAALFASVVERLHDVVRRLWSLPKPVIAGVNGVASGAGLSLAAACDLRVVAESAFFKASYTAIGLTPDAGWTVLVPALIGHGRAAELLLLEHRVGAARAVAIGLANEVCPDAELRARAGALARQAAAHPPGAWAGGKTLLHAALRDRLEEQLERERRTVVARAASAGFVERLAAFLKR